MPTLGFLKKKRTKDSNGSRDFDSPTSPVKDTPSPVTPTGSRKSGSFHLHKTKTNDSSTTATSAHNLTNTTSHDATASAASGASAASASSTTKPADSMNPAHAQQQQQQQPPSAQQQQQQQAHQQLQPQHYGAASPQSNPQHSRNSPSIQNLIHPNNTTSHQAPAKNGAVQFQTQPLNQTRVTKGKYSLSDFTIQRTLGTGSFGRVHLVQSKHNQRFYAVKVLKKAQVVKMKQVEHTNDERRMLQQVKHPFLITLWGTFQDSKNLYMVMDFVEGGELFSLLRKSQVPIPQILSFSSLCLPSPAAMLGINGLISTAISQPGRKVLRRRGYARVGLPALAQHHLPRLEA
jgi:protein kinase A